MAPTLLRGSRAGDALRHGRGGNDQTQVWHDEHPMVAVSFDELQTLLQPYFEVHVFEHDYEKLIPWSGTSGNALFACVKR